MSEADQDLSASVPEGFERPVVADDPRRPGVRLSELRRGPMGRPLREDEPSWLKWLAAGLLFVLILGGLVFAFGMLGIFIAIGLAIVVLLAAILARLLAPH